MRPFEYIKPSTVDEATSFLSQNAEDSLIMGGGTAAVVLLHLGVVRPRYVVDLGGIGALRETTMKGSLHLGALTSIRSLERDPAIAADYNLLSEAASQVANIRVRNAASVGGAVAYGEPQTDTPVALTALDATVEIAGASGARQIPIAAPMRLRWNRVSWLSGSTS
ncbi:MAG: FAD binding domain-containing protein [Chloroflexi bacterium]|nr:FAD binding domain-containing protein [Chloroflexota bacterium]